MSGVEGATCGAFIAEVERLLGDRGVIASYGASLVAVVSRPVD